MTTIIKDNRLTGVEVRSAQFLNGSPDCNRYPLRIIMDGADITGVVKHALNDGIIVLRKRIKTKAQAEALADGITFAQMVAAQPKDSNSMAASIDPEELSDDVAAALIAKLQARMEKNEE